MKRILVAVISTVFVLTYALGVSFAASPSTSSVLESATTNVLSQQATSEHLIVKTESVTPLAVSTVGNNITATYTVNWTHVLNFASPDDVPIMKGLAQGLKGLQLGMTGRGQAVRDYVAQWRSDLQSYITTPMASSEILKATATLGPDGAVVPGSTQVFGLADENGDWVSSQSFLSSIPSPSTEQANGRDAVLKFAETAPEVPTATSSFTNTSVKGVSPDGSVPYDAYSGSEAVWYAEQYTSNNDSGACSAPTTEYTPAWNLGQYPSYAPCNDCADFVSQAMHYGGIPETSSWQPIISPVTSDPTGDWYYVPSLQAYFTNSSNPDGYWSSTTEWGVVAGDVVEESNQGHVELVDANTGSALYFDSHTSDRKQFEYWTNNVAQDPWIGADGITTLSWHVTYYVTN